MPTIVTRGAASARGFGFGSANIKPAMIRTGAVGTITPNAAGYALSGFDDNTYAYLDAAKSSGKWYWEQVVDNYVLSGITITPTTPQAFGGYTTKNGGVYNASGSFWNEWGSTPASLGAISPGAVLGFALDVGGKTLSIYLNNGAANTLALTSITTPIYPMFATQSGPNTQIKLGFGQCSYTPPAGYSYL